MVEKDFENDFNPEFSEYNPVLLELNKEVKKEDEGFIASLIQKLTTGILITEW